MSHALRSLLARLSDPVVRDLAWALASPNLLQVSQQAPDNDWYRQLLDEYQPRLFELDAAPELLHAHCRTYRRLGLYFEALWHFFLLDHHRFQLLAYNWQQVVDGTTLGAFDFIVWDRASQRIEHWELAVKFYLISDPGAPYGHGCGINPRDKLRHKVEHMLHHQLRLSQHPTIRERLGQLKIMPQKTRMILKGRLYYPSGCQQFLSEQGERGYWGLAHPDASFEPQQKMGWLTGGRLGDHRDKKQNFHNREGNWYIRVDEEWLDIRGK